MQEFSEFCAKWGLLRRGVAVFWVLTAALSGCSADSDSALPVAPAAAPANRCGSDGFLATELFGALQARLQWNAADLECEGMPRPDGDGARLRFAGDLEGRQIAFINALPDLRRGVAGKELPSMVTVIEEGSGRFFSTVDSNVCWTDIAELEAIDPSDANYRIGGRLYCVAPLTQVNGASEILIRDLEFRGLLTWGGS